MSTRRPITASAAWRRAVPTATACGARAKLPPSWDEVRAEELSGTRDPVGASVTGLRENEQIVLAPDIVANGGVTPACGSARSGSR